MNRLNGLMSGFMRSLKADAEPDRRCSFCRKSYATVGPLVEGPGRVFICGACVDLCGSVIEHERARRAGVKFAAAGIQAARAWPGKPDPQAAPEDDEPAERRTLTDYGRIAQKVSRNRVSFAALRPREEDGIVPPLVAARRVTISLLRLSLLASVIFVAGTVLFLYGVVLALLIRDITS